MKEIKTIWLNKREKRLLEVEEFLLEKESQLNDKNRDHDLFCAVNTKYQHKRRNSKNDHSFDIRQKKVINNL